MMLNDIARGLARRIPLTKLVQLEGDVRPYLASHMIAALNKAGDELVVPDTLRIRMLTEEAFENMLKAEAGKTYHNYGMIAKDLLGMKTEDKPLTAAETDRLQRERLNDVLGEVVKVLEKLNDNDGDSSDDDASDAGSVKM